MKKVKLIRTYPGSPKLGTILTPKTDVENTNTNNFYWEGSWFNPNDFCDFWEEVIEKGYEILSYSSFTTTTSKQIFTKGIEGFGEIGKYNMFPIHSVKRLSDGEVFTVGDTIKVRNFGSNHIVDTITIANGGNSLKEGVWLNYEGGSQHFSNTIKDIKKDYEVAQVLYATEIRTLYEGQYRIFCDGVGFDLDYLLKNGGKIYSVNRMSDGERFTVGDRINIGEEHQIIIRTISMINIKSSGELVIDHEHGGLTNNKLVGIFHRIKHVPLEYEIISYVKKDRPNCITTKKRGGQRHDEFWNIHSVKRLSDGEDFTIGDNTSDGIISEIHSHDSYTGGILFKIKDKTISISINGAKKVELPVLFITEDGVEIREGSNKVWWLDREYRLYDTYFGPKDICYKEDKYFSTREAAVAYRLRYKPCLSLDDIQRAINLPPMFWEALLAAAKSKIKHG